MIKEKNKKTDLGYLLHMTNNNNALILEMIDIFVVQVEEMWNDMQKYIDSQDFESLGKLAHKAKSSVAIMGMDSLSHKLKDLEVCCNEKKDLNNLQFFIDIFKRDCQEATRELTLYKMNQHTQKTNKHA